MILGTLQTDNQLEKQLVNHRCKIVENTSEVTGHLTLKWKLKVHVVINHNYFIIETKWFTCKKRSMGMCKDFINHYAIKCCNPTLGLSVRMQLTLPKVGKWSPSGLPKSQKMI